MIGTTVAVPAKHLAYGHVGYVRAADGLAACSREFNEAEAKRRREDRTATIRALIALATGRDIITPEQAESLWLLESEISSLPLSGPTLHDPAYWLSQSR